MSYLKYSGLCADMVRAALKEPAKTKARTREVVFFRRAEWKDGQPQKQCKLWIASRALRACFCIQVNPLHQSVESSVRQSSAGAPGPDYSSG